MKYRPSKIEREINAQLALVRPPAKLTVSQWADQNRYVSRGVSPEPGLWRSDRLPYCREPMDAITDPDCEEVILRVASQLFKTELILNAVGYFIDHDPCPILVVYPTVDSAKKWSQKKASPMIRDTPCLRDKLRPARSRDSGNTILSKEFPGGNLIIAGSNSPPSMRQISVRAVLQDEIDAYELSAGAEGDPCALADVRAEAYPNAVLVKASTPTIKGLSRIDMLFEQSDQRYWFCPCSKCGHFQTLKWSQVKWTWTNKDGTKRTAPEKACYVCEQCKAELSDYERVRMIMAGEWRPTAQFTRKRGYHLSGLYRIMGAKRGYASFLHQFVNQFLKANAGGAETLKVFTNTFIAESWEAIADSVDSEPIMARREDYGPDLPAGALVLVGSADIQEDRIESEIIAFGLEEESWGIRYQVMTGNTDRAEVWKELEAFWDQKFKHPSGVELQVACGVVDAGYRPKNVYAFTKPNQYRRWYAVHGAATPGSPLVSRAKKSSIRQAVLFTIGSDAAKGLIYSRLKIPDPGPRYMHFPHGYGYDHEFFSQLTAERVVTEKIRGFSVRKWHKTRPRNEALDIRAYSLAAVEILNPAWEELAKQLAVDETDDSLTTSKKDDTMKEPANQPEPPRARIRRGWVGGWKRF